MGTGNGEDQPSPGAGTSDHFATTRWTLVLNAGNGASGSSRVAMAELCALYWYPLYAFIRRKGHGPDAAQDLTQGFFARLLERNIVGTADPARGRFRSYLLGAVQHFLADRRDHDRALKRGGGNVTVSRDLDTGEDRYRLEPLDHATPERLFDRQWAATVIGLALADLRRRYEAEGKADVFDTLRQFLVSGPGDEGQAEAAARLGTSPGAARVALHRMRRRYRELLRAQVAQTVSSPEEVDDEIRELFEASRR